MHWKQNSIIQLCAMVAMALTIFNGCQKDELISQMADEQLPLVEKSLSLEKVILKKKLNETAKIVASILSDESTLTEITDLILKLPREMEDRLMLADLLMVLTGLLLDSAMTCISQHHATFGKVKLKY